MTRSDTIGRRKKPRIRATLADLIARGLISPPLSLTGQYRGQRLEAMLLKSGEVEVRGEPFRSCSSAAEAAKWIAARRKVSTNGWRFWSYRDEAGNLVLLDDARKSYLAAPADDLQVSG